MDYEQVIEDMFNRLPMFSRIGPAAYKADLSNTITLCNFTGNPEKNLRCIHIAGTNGKGSVSNMLASVFQEAGYKTGLYTSPHLKDFRERIRINGKKIRQQEVVKYYSQIIDKVNDIQASFFEMTVIMAFMYFSDNNTDIAIIETGLGGRLDSTNTVTPDLSIITNIGLDHQALLGNTLKEIAGEKAGIIKPGKPVLIGEYHPDTAPVFNKISKEQNAPIFYGKDFHHSIQLVNGEFFLINQKEVHCPLLGRYQIKNIRTVLSALQVYQDFYPDMKIQEEHILSGLENVVTNTEFHGRWQITQQHPKVIMDVGHNEDGLRYILQQIKTLQYKHLRIIYGAVKDKNVRDILRSFPTENTSYYLCEPSVPRKLPLEELLTIAEDIGLPYVFYEKSPIKVYQKALKDADKEDTVLVLGSSFVVGEIL